MNTLFIQFHKLVLASLVFLFSCQFGGKLSEVSIGNERYSTAVEIDFKGNIYVIDEGNELKKFNRSGNLLFTFSHPEYGGISGMDVTDPHKILLFYKDQQKLIILDNSLVILSMVDFTKMENIYAGLCRRSEEGFYWIYDINAQKLISLDENLLILNESFSLYREGIIDFSPLYMDVGLKWIILGDPNQGIVIFDHLANFNKKIPDKDFSGILTQKELIYFTGKNSFYHYDPLNFKKEVVMVFQETEYDYYGWDLVNGTLQFFNRYNNQLKLMKEVFLRE